MAARRKTVCSQVGEDAAITGCSHLASINPPGVLLRVQCALRMENVSTAALEEISRDIATEHHSDILSLGGEAALVNLSVHVVALLLTFLVMKGGKSRLSSLLHPNQIQRSYTQAAGHPFGVIISWLWA